MEENYDQISSTEIYNVDEKKWFDGPSMTTARSCHIAAAMSENRVVVAGGGNTSGFLNTAEVITFNLDRTTR